MILPFPRKNIQSVDGFFSCFLESRKKKDNIFLDREVQFSLDSNWIWHHLEVLKILGEFIYQNHLDNNVSSKNISILSDTWNYSESSIVVDNINQMILIKVFNIVIFSI